MGQRNSRIVANPKPEWNKSDKKQIAYNNFSLNSIKPHFTYCATSKVLTLIASILMIWSSLKSKFSNHSWQIVFARLWSTFVSTLKTQFWTIIGFYSYHGYGLVPCLGSSVHKALIAERCAIYFELFFPGFFIFLLELHPPVIDWSFWTASFGKLSIMDALAKLEVRLKLCILDSCLSAQRFNLAPPLLISSLWAPLSLN